ncbi:MAG: GldG family protein, partial [Butyrivibrio sp.]|nr:GldG family protein [Butyrivibrio sp.]
AYSTITVIVMVAIVVVANIAALQIPDSIREIDVTSQNLFSLTEDTKTLVAGVEDDITLYFLADENDNEGSTKDETVEKILLQYANLSDNVTLTYIDPVVNSQFAAKYSDTGLSYSSVIVVNNTNERYKVVDYNDMFESEFDYTTYSSTLTGYDIEGQLTNALQYVMLSDDSFMQAYVLTGHNESSFATSFSELFDQFSITTQSLSLLTSESVPEDCELLIINTPTTDLTDDETARIIDYIDNGGDVLFMFGYVEDDMTNFKKVLAEYGINWEDGLLMETSKENLLAGYPEYYILPEIGTSDIASSLSNSGNVLAIMSMPFTYETQDDVTMESILTTTESAYTAVNPSVSTEKTDDSQTGLFYIGLKATKTVEADDAESVAIVYSCPYLFLEDVDAYVQGNNSKLFGNTLNALSDVEVDYVTVPVKEVDQNLSINLKTCYLVLCSMAAAVVLILGFGIVTWVVRSKK